MYSKTSTYTTEHDQVYSQTLKQKEEDRNAGSFLVRMSSPEKYEADRMVIPIAAERDAKASWQNHTGGKTFFEESLDEKKRKDEEERQRRGYPSFLE